MGENQQNNNNQIAGALTFPRRNEENVQPLPEQPRQPRNLQGLLRFAMEATKSEDAPGNSNFTPMDDERRLFLEEALKSLTVDMSEMIRTAIKILSDSEKISSIQLDDSLPDDVRQSFENLLDLVHDMDVANDFYKMGGFSIFPVCLGCENNSVRALASTVLAEACQNNPYCQSMLLECGLFSVILSLLQQDTGEALAKEVYALSCACREFEPACLELVSQDGCPTLARLLTAEEPATRTKAAFLIRYLCHMYRDAKEKFIEMNIVKSVAEQIQNGHDYTTEHMINVLCVLLRERNATVFQQCAEAGIQKLLEKHLQHPNLEDGSFLEEKEYCQEVLQILRSCPPVERLNEEVDR